MRLARLDHFTAQQSEWRLVVELYIVKRIGKDFAHPYQARLHILDKKQMNRSKQQSAGADGQPHDPGVMNKPLDVRERVENAEQAGIRHQQQGRGSPNRHQHHLCGAGCSRP